MARLLLLGAFVVVLGSTLGDEQFKSKIHRVNVLVDYLGDAYNTLKSRTFTSKSFYAKCLGPDTAGYAQEESIVSELLPRVLGCIADDVNPFFYKYNERLANGEELSQNELGTYERVIKVAMVQLKGVRKAAVNQEQAEQVENYCHDLYENIVLLKACGGMMKNLLS